MSDDETFSPMSFEDICRVLGAFWGDYRDAGQADEVWSEFFDYNDVGLPLAYMVAEELVDGVSEEAEEILDETWEMFCQYLAIDPVDYYESLEVAFNRSSKPRLHADESDSVEQDPEELAEVSDHGLEGFMGRRTGSPNGGSARGKGKHIDDDLPLEISKSTWQTIDDACRRSGREGSHLRIHVLPCSCGAYHQGIGFDTNWYVNDVSISNGSVTVVADRESAKLLRNARIEIDERADRIRGVPRLRLNTSGLNECRCGDTWRPAAAVAGIAATFGIAKRNSAVANEWNTGSDDSFDPSDAINAAIDYLEQEEAESSDLDFDIGGF